MAGRMTMRAELDQLRADLDRLRQAKERAGAASGPDEEGGAAKDLPSALQNLIDEAESAVEDHPVAAVVVALVAGVVLGRLISR